MPGPTFMLRNLYHYLNRVSFFSTLFLQGWNINGEGGHRNIHWGREGNNKIKMEGRTNELKHHLNYIVIFISSIVSSALQYWFNPKSLDNMKLNCWHQLTEIITLWSCVFNCCHRPTKMQQEVFYNSQQISSSWYHMWFLLKRPSCSQFHCNVMILILVNQSVSFNYFSIWAAR